MENIRTEISSLRNQQNLNVRSQSIPRALNSLLASSPGNEKTDPSALTNPTRVKKLTKFFGDEPPLLRLFLKKLGYEVRIRFAYLPPRSNPPPLPRNKDKKEWTVFILFCCVTEIRRSFRKWKNRYGRIAVPDGRKITKNGDTDGTQIEDITRSTNIIL